MDETTLKALIESLQTHKDSLNFLLNAFSFAVAIGVVLEIVFVLRQYHEELSDWKRGFVHPPSRPSRLWLWFELAGVALVSIGVAGEFWIDVKAGTLESQIREANGSLVILLEKRVKNAEESANGAAYAAERAKSAEKELENDVLWSGNRDVLIRASQSTFKDRLSSFKRQRFRMSVCASDVTIGTDPYSEVETAQAAIRVALSAIGWRNSMWLGTDSNTRVPVMTIAACSNQPGVYTSFTPHAGKSTRAASQALQGALNTVLRQDVSLGPFPTYGASRSLNASDRLQDNEIDIEVDAHPAVPGDPRKTSP